MRTLMPGFSADVHSPIVFFRQLLCLPTLLVSNFDTSVRKCANVLWAAWMAGSGADLAQALSAYEAERCPATRRIVRQTAPHPSNLIVDTVERMTGGGRSSPSRTSS